MSTSPMTDVLPNLSGVGTRFKQRVTGLARRLLDGEVEHLVMLRVSIEGARLTPDYTDHLLDRAEEAWQGVCSEVRLLADPERDTITVFVYGPSAKAICGRLSRLTGEYDSLQLSGCQCQKGRCFPGRRQARWH
jgi:hypothetical protein